MKASLRGTMSYESPRNAVMSRPVERKPAIRRRTAELPPWVSPIGGLVRISGCMSPVRLLVALSVVAFLLVWVPTASADHGCQAPPGTAAVDQYCDNLPTADGTTDPSGKHVPRLVSVLPQAVADRLRRHGLLGEVLLALPAGDAGSRGARPLVAVRRVPFEPRDNALLPGPAANARSVIHATTSSSGLTAVMGWALGLTLFGLAAVSLWGALRRE
jgi:hypothetical protein